MARAIGQGVRPFRELAVSHTTAVMYLLAPVSILFPEPDTFHRAALVVTFVIILICGYLICRTAQLLDCSRNESYVAAGITVLSLLFLGGTDVQLEPWLAACLLGALYFIVRWRLQGRPGWLLLLAGLCGGAAVIMKQYGAGHVVVLGVCVLLFDRETISLRQRTRETALLWLTAIAVIAFYLGSLSLAAGVPLRTVAWTFSGAWYEKDSASFLDYIKIVSAIHPFALFIPWVLIKPRRPYAGAIVALALTSLLPGFIRQYAHYYALGAPFFSIGFVYLLSTVRQRFQLSPIPLQLLAALMLIPSFMQCTQLIQVLGAGYRQQQLEIADNLTEVIPPGSKVLLLGDHALWFLCRFESPAPTELGYSFPEVIGRARILDVAKRADFIIFHSKWAPNHHPYMIRIPPWSSIEAVIEGTHERLPDVAHYWIYRHRLRSSDRVKLEGTSPSDGLSAN